MSTDPSQDKYGFLKRFLAIFFLFTAIALGISAATGSMPVLLGILAAVCLCLGLFLARSFAFLRSKEF